MLMKGRNQPPLLLRTTPRGIKLRHMPTRPDITLAVGRAPWWISHSALSLKNKKREKPTFAEALRDFLENVSFHCYGKLVEPGRRFQERFFWLMFHAAALAILIIFLWNTYDNDSGRLLATTIYDPLYSVTKVAFPAISICSINRISNASAMRYAEELRIKDPLNRGVEFFYKQIRMLSYNYYSQNDNLDYESALDFQRFLDLYDTEDAELFYNTRRRMTMLTPRCSSLLLECRLGGLEVNCSVEFEENLTSRGVCCTFNKAGKYAKKRDFKMRFFGPDQGLAVLLNSSHSDRFFKTSRLEGFVAMVYSHTNFPDVSSGAVKERLIQAGFDNYFFVSSKVLETVNEARVLSPKMRNCYFNDEMPRAFGKQYTFNKCITRCRVRSILILCGCLMFQMPYEYLDVATNTVFCTLQHAECLKRYNFKWLNVITRREYVYGLEHEMEDALYCPFCLPSCSETLYGVATNGLPLNAFNMRMFSKPFDSNNNTDLAVLRVSFAQTHVRYFKQILQNSWFEVFSTVGNICGIITGFSLIAFCEILFFLTRQIWLACRDEISTEQNHNRQRLNTKEALKKENFIILP